MLKPRTIEVNIPAGVRDGSMVRLAGQGGAGFGGAPSGDLYLRIRLRPHPTFMVRGDDLEIEVPVAPWEAVLGARVEVPTIEKQVELVVPAGAQAGQRLRLRGQGLNKRKGGRGDLYEASVQMFADRPILGHGPSTYSWARFLYGTEPARVLAVRLTHDVPLQTLVDGGILAVL